MVQLNIMKWRNSMRGYTAENPSEMDKAWKTHVFKNGVMLQEVVDANHVRLSKVYLKYWLKFCIKTDRVMKKVHSKGNKGGP